MSGLNPVPFSIADPGARRFAWPVLAAGRAISKAPISHAGPAGRSTPRWSVAGQPLLSPPLIAGLPGLGAIVGVGPPFAASGPSIGSRAGPSEQVAASS